MPTIYTTPTCHYCNDVKNFFKNNNIAYSEVTISETDDDARQFIIKKTGMMAVPVTQIGNNFVTGFDEKQLRQLLQL